tara:strand:+ start:375 stop:1025 length:651 start_codon:yes stop_codon:yes gene_type:complete
MLIPINTNQVSKLIPSVATGGQFKYSLGNPRKILQRLIISSIGAAITLVIGNNQFGNQTDVLWLILCLMFALYILWGPILEASRKNLRFKKLKFFSIFEGIISDIYQTERVETSREQTNRYGKLELIQNKRIWLNIELDDEDGYLSKISFPMENKHNQLKQGLKIRCLVSSNERSFNGKLFLSDAWLPEINLWVGDYPYLLRPAFEEICYLYKNNF